uniref:hypothetical protein n=1 Tax=Carnobacterium sp. TaxID=48221 RepID=UPI00344D9E86
MKVKGGKRMKQKKISLVMIMSFVLIVLGGCSVSSANTNKGVLDKESIYSGTYATNEVINVLSDKEWKITFHNEDPNTYTIANISATDEKIGEYKVYNVKAKEINGEGSPFAKLEGRDYIFTKDEEGLYFIVISNDTILDHTAGIVEGNDPDEYIKDNAKYRFQKN